MRTRSTGNINSIIHDNININKQKMQKRIFYIYCCWWTKKKDDSQMQVVLDAVAMAEFNTACLEDNETRGLGEALNSLEECQHQEI